MKKKIYIKPDCCLLPAPMLMNPTVLSDQQIGPTGPSEPIGGEGDPDDEGDAKLRLWDTSGYDIPNSLW